MTLNNFVIRKHSRNLNFAVSHTSQLLIKLYVLYSELFIVVLWERVLSQHQPKYRASTSSKASWERLMAAAAAGQV